MIKLMIVEDEPLALMGLKSLVNWEENQYELIHLAVNGKDALEKIQERCPDIILTDLMMDTMNGFELMQVCREEYPHIKFIVLSNYNDFDNVRKAMRCGAVDYVFKLTVTPNEILEVLDSIKKECIIPQEKSLDYKVPVLHTNLSFNAMSIDANQNMQILYLLTDHMHFSILETHDESRSLLNFVVYNILLESLDEVWKFQLFEYHEGMYIMAFNTPQTIEKDNEIIVKIYHQLQTCVKQILGLKLTAVLSQPFVGIQELKNAVRQFDIVRDGLFFSQSNQLYSGVDLYTNDKPTNCMQIELKNLEDALGIMDLPEARKQLESILQGYQLVTQPIINADSRQQKKTVISQFRRLYKVIYVVFMKYGVNIDEILNDKGINLEDVFLDYRYLDECKKQFLSFFDQYVDDYKKIKTKPYRTEVLEAKQMVQNNLQGDLSVKTISEKLNLSESRFSHLFKQETGQSFIDYVLQCKLSKAMHLLKTTDMRINQIGIQIGVENQNYFSSQFKKKTGFSPREYRNRSWIDE